MFISLRSLDVKTLRPIKNERKKERKNVKALMYLYLKSTHKLAKKQY